MLSRLLSPFRRKPLTAEEARAVRWFLRLVHLGWARDEADLWPHEARIASLALRHGYVRDGGFWNPGYTVTRKGERFLADPQYRCKRCGRDEIDARANGCKRGPCPMEPVK